MYFKTRSTSVFRKLQGHELEATTVDTRMFKIMFDKLFSIKHFIV